MPIFRSVECFRFFRQRHDEGLAPDSKEKFVLEKDMLIANQLTFLFINYLELAYMYYIWRRLKKVKENKMNIRKELQVSTFSWIFFSVIYFVSIIFKSLAKGGSSDGDSSASLYIGLLGILCRDLFAFMGTTCFTIRDLWFKEDEDI
mmetsp:Transcript_1993/g.3512  ORF Transcript_1993/g.3512 Transcript_1993/m.3512 type:complete len:147 (+) Transcript_1993:753-1193(+)